MKLRNIHNNASLFFLLFTCIIRKPAVVVSGERGHNIVIGHDYSKPGQHSNADVVAAIEHEASAALQKEEYYYETPERELNSRRRCARSPTCRDLQGRKKANCISSCEINRKCKNTRACRKKKSQGSAKTKCIDRCKEVEHCNVNCRNKIGGRDPRSLKICLKACQPTAAKPADGSATTSKKDEDGSSSATHGAVTSFEAPCPCLWDRGFGWVGVLVKDVSTSLIDCHLFRDAKRRIKKGRIVCDLSCNAEPSTAPSVVPSALSTRYPPARVPTEDPTNITSTNVPSSAISSAPSKAPSPAPTPALKPPVLGVWTYHQLINYPRAKCLDGSPGAYYIRYGTNTNKVLFHLQGGGWCSDTSPDSVGKRSNCASRALTDSGSTIFDDPLDGKYAGIFSLEETKNPAFHDWTHVFVRYCDGASFSGRVISPIDTSYEPRMPQVYSRGNFILEDTIDELFLKNGSPLSSTTHFVLNGGSAGGLGVYLHAHQVWNWLPNSINLAAIPDSGFFPEWYAMGKDWVYGENMKGVFQISQAQATLPPGCLQDQNGTEYRCMFAAEVVPHIPIPMFVVNSNVDSFQVKRILGYDPSLNGIDKTDVNLFAEMVSDQIQAAVAAQEANFVGIGSGVFITSCYEHVLCKENPLYTAVNVDGVPVKDAVYLWITQTFNGIPTSPINWISSNSFGCKACCTNKK